jgi:rare lipoprotein A
MMKVKAYALAIVLCSVVAGAAQAESGLASIYGNGDGYAGRKTASGERMNPRALTAAHRSLPFGSRVRVTNRKNGRSAIVRISDRGPFVRGRIIDLTPAAARALGFSGLAPVSVNRVTG